LYFVTGVVKGPAAYSFISYPEYAGGSFLWNVGIPDMKQYIVITETTTGFIFLIAV